MQPVETMNEGAAAEAVGATKRTQMRGDRL